MNKIGSKWGKNVTGSFLAQLSRLLVVMVLSVSHLVAFIRVHLVNNQQLGRFFMLSEKASTYNKAMINSYTEKVLWKPTLINQYQLEGYPSSPYPSCDPIVIPKNTSRKLEVLLFNIFYKNNIFQSSLYRIGKAISPMCTQCGYDEETAVHILFSCSSVPEELRSRSLQSYAKAVKCEIDDIDTTDIYTGFLNASRNSLHTIMHRYIEAPQF